MRPQYSLQMFLRDAATVFVMALAISLTTAAGVLALLFLMGF